MDELRSRIAHAAGWATAVLSGLTLSDYGIVIGILCSIGTFGVNLYYTRRRFAREQQG